MKLQAWIDGACEPNPGGKAGYGLLVRLDETIIHQESKFLGQGHLMSNNVAEFCALLALIKWNKAKVPIAVYSDSQLLTNVMNGMWKAKQGLYLSVYYDIWNNLKRQGIPHNYTFIWVDREENVEADNLSKLAMTKS